MVLLLPYVQRLLCGIAPILFTALAVWCCFCLMYSGCYVVLLLPYDQQLLCDFASMWSQSHLVIVPAAELVHV